MNTNAEDLAYPFEQHDGNEVYWHGGLTKREYFAAMRKEPLFGNDTMSESWAKAIMGSEIPKEPLIENIKWWIEAHERFAVMKADALIEALNKNK